MTPAPATVVIAAAPAVAAEPIQQAASGFVTVWGVSISPMAAVLILVIAVAAYGLWKAQRDSGKNTFDVWDLMMDTIAPTPGQPESSRRASAIKLFFNGAFILSSWLVVDQELKNSPLLPSIFGIYMATWGAALIAKVVYDAKAIPNFNIPGGKKDGE